jgi:hypothetical protein
MYKYLNISKLHEYDHTYECIYHTHECVEHIRGEGYHIKIM